ncbi:hypothetical protein H310_14043 [Aphanomyces invadans]|uniref:Peptidase S1 domain-containing protein n=1 Tax=Aphanomyces invadans TaxID=157072 RepID=A0A024TBE4_9STRA|nr:hypothetical protein H310_14043 [Aphanomyces invadans]ETV91363.1 hypothetical protein H310_14043 [Aphanomyces invadans]|eukprot:XP_008879991.1 hypothetical protein H310_14043 [Aphanomyces invadans]
MTKFLALATLSAFAAARPEIFGGIEVPKGQSTYVASLRETEAGPTLCGATLIAPKVLLTAASCVDLSPYYASIGSHFSSGNQDGERIKIVKTTVHPMYNKDTSGYDIAILELETASKFTPVAVNLKEDAATDPGAVSWMRGFGKTTSFKKDNSPVLLEAERNILSNDECQKALEHDFEALESVVCTTSGKGPCDGDIGAPLIIVRDGVEYVAGVSISEYTCADIKLPSVYSRVSAAREFIKPFLADTLPQTPSLLAK